MVTKEDVDVVDALGGKFADAGAKLCRELDIKGGVQVVGIKADGILARARVKQGFVITHINDRPVYSLGDMQRMTERSVRSTAFIPTAVRQATRWWSKSQPGRVYGLQYY